MPRPIEYDRSKFLKKSTSLFLERGFDEYFGQLCLIEWPEKIEAVLPSERIHITIEYNGENKRIITYEET